MRIREVNPPPGNGSSSPNKFDALGDPVARELPGHKLTMKVSPAEFRDDDSSEPSGSSDATTMARDLLSQHEAELLERGGQSLVDALTAFANGDDSAVRESLRSRLLGEKPARTPKPHTGKTLAKFADRLR